jgi:hypothetical protein
MLRRESRSQAHLVLKPKENINAKV